MTTGKSIKNKLKFILSCIMAEKSKKGLSLVIIISIIFSLLPTFDVQAAGGIYNIGSADVTISSAGTYTVTGSTTIHKIIVNENLGTVNLTLEGVTIDISMGGNNNVINASALSIGNGTTVILNLVGSNTLVGGGYCAGIHVPVGAALEIGANDNTSTLTAKGQSYFDSENMGAAGAGIGGNGTAAKDSANGESCGMVTINAGTITAIGGSSSPKYDQGGGAGIGGGGTYSGTSGSCGTITINNGIVNATSSANYNACGIGAGGTSQFAGTQGTGGVVIINAGYVNATTQHSMGYGIISDANVFYGGSINTVGASNATNDGVMAVYGTIIDLPVGCENKAVTYTIDGDANVYHAYTDNDGILYPWVPASASEDANDIKVVSVNMVDSGSTYKAGGTVREYSYNTLTVLEPPSITDQPDPATVNVNDTATLSLTATGNGALSYQWYKNDTDSTTGGTAVQNAASASFNPSTETAGTGYYYCVVTNSIGSLTASTTSSTAAVTVNGTVETPGFTNYDTQEVKYIGQTAAFTTGAYVNDGGTLTYQWEVSTDKGSTWNPVTTGTGYDEETYTTDPVTGEQNSYLYHCIVTNHHDGLTASKTWGPGQLLVKAAIPYVIIDPSSRSDLAPGASTTISVTATIVDGGTMSYQWQTCHQGEAWVDMTGEGYSGSNITGGSLSTSIPINNVTGADDHTYYQCVVTNKNGSLTATKASNPCGVFVHSAQASSTNPQDATKLAGETATFGITASVSDGGKLSYQWQYSTDNEVTWNPVTTGTGGTTNTYTTDTLAASDTGTKYRCAVTNTLLGATSVRNTYAATLTVYPENPPTITVTGNPTQWTTSALLAIAGTTGGSGIKSVTVNDQDITATYGNGYEVTQNGVYTFVLTSNYDVTATQAINVTYIDSTAPNQAVITNADKYNSSTWYSENQTITAGFTTTTGCDEILQYSVNGSEWVNGTSADVTTEGTNTVNFKVKDALGREGSESSVTVLLDKTSPDAPVITDADKYINTKWYNTDQTVSATYTPSGTGSPEKLQYRINGGVWTDGSSAGFTADGIYTVDFRVIDETGNASQLESATVQIDKTSPINANITANSNSFTSFLNDITFNTFFKETVDVNITADCDIAGLKSIQYQKVADKTEYDENGTWTTGSTLHVAPDEKFIVYAKITDNAGNSVIINTDGLEADATSPLLSLSEVNGWKTSNITIGVSASDNLSGLKNVTYTTDETTPQSGTVTITNGTGTIQLTKEGAYKLTVVGTDNAGNSITKTIDIKLDKTAPAIQITGNPTNWANGATLGITPATVVSGIKSVTVNGEDITDSYLHGYSVLSNGSYIFVVTSNADLTDTKMVDVNYLDSTAPNKPVITDAEKYTDTKWYNTNQTVSATFTPMVGGSTEKIQYRINGGAWIDGSSTDITTEGLNTVGFRVIDEAGNISALESATVQIDKTSPINATIMANSNPFTSFLNEITFHTFFKETVDLNITANGEISGIKSIEYQKVADKAEYDENGTWTTGSSFHVSPDDKFIVYARITDNAGNSIIINTNGIEVDATTPSVSLSDVSGWKTSNITVDVAASDNLSGLQNVTYTTDEATPQSGTVIITNGTGTIQLTNEGVYQLSVTGTDNAGNSIVKTVAIKLDKTTPAVQVTGNPTAWTSSATLGITATSGVSGIKSVTVNGVDITDSYTNGYSIPSNGSYTFVVTSNTGLTDTKTMDVSYLDITTPDNAVIANAENFTSAKWYNTEQTVSATFTTTPGCNEKLQYSTDGGTTWADGESVIVSSEGTNTVSFRVIDTLGKVSQKESSVIVQIDKTAPEAPFVNDVDSNTTKVTGTTEAGATIIIKDEAGNTIGTATAGTDGTYAISIKVQSADTNLYVTATDEAGNKSSKTKVTVKDALAYINALIDALPNPSTASDSDIINAQDKITEAKQHYDSLNASQRNAINAARKEKLNSLITKLNALLVIESKDKATGIAASGIGTAVLVPELETAGVGKVQIALSVDPVTTTSGTTIPGNIRIATTSLNNGGQTLLAAYDISLIKSIYGTSGSLDSQAKVNNSDIVDYITIRIPVPNGYTGRTDLTIVYIDDNGNVTNLTSKIVTIDGVEYIEFQTNHFSEYAIVAKTPASDTTASGTSSTASTTSTTGTAGSASTGTSPQTGDTSPLIPLIAVLAISGILLVTVIIRRKRFMKSDK